MNTDENTDLSARVQELSMVSDENWGRVLPRYRLAQTQGSLVPTWMLIMVLFLGSAMMLMALVGIKSIWLAFAVTVAMISAFLLGNRFGNDEGFKAGYEWGKEDGVCAALGISEEEKSEYLNTDD